MSQPDPRAVVRDATEADLVAVAAIYDAEVTGGYATFDTEPPAPDYWAAKLGGPLLVAEEDGVVVGFAYATSYRPRAAYDRTREVSVYLAPAGQGRGLGRALYTVLLDRLRDAGVHTVLAVIATPNDGSEALHRSFGFERVGLLPEVGWKLERWIDVAFWALVLERD
jgi:L-amino acid N-acyltransferase YncA